MTFIIYEWKIVPRAELNQYLRTKLLLCTEDYISAEVNTKMVCMLPSIK